MTQPSSSRIVTEAANATVSAADRARGNHTGTQTADTITDGATNKAYTATERTKLAGIATGATANRADSATDAAISTAISTLVGAAPAALDTLKEIDDQIAADEGTAAALAAAVSQKSLSLPVNAMSANGTALIGARNSINASAGPVAVTMPTPTAVGQHMIIERADASAVTANAITITGTIRGTAGTIVTLAAVGAAFEGALYIAESLTSWAVAASIKPRAVLDAAYDAKGAAAAAVAGLITIVDNGDGTYNITGPGVVDNGDGTFTFTNAAGEVSYTKARIDTLFTAKVPMPAAGDATGSVPTKQANGSIAYVLPSGGTASNIQVFEASGTWTKPANCNVVHVVTVAGGGGGGSGRRTLSGTAASGGGGGGGGSMGDRVLPAAALPATVAITVGAGGAGGGAATVDSTNGTTGANGNPSSFGTYVRSNGGFAGGAGGTTAGTSGTGGLGQFGGGGGAAGGLGAAGGTAGSSALAPAGGGGGAGIPTTPAAFAGGTSGFSIDQNNSVAGGTSGGGNGTAGPTTNGTGVAVSVAGGGGGGSNIAGAGGNGGTGGSYGGGGGGGAASIGGNSGAGGTGGAGVVIVIAY